MTSKEPDSIDRIVGRNIRICRLQKGLTQTELADALGLTFQQVQKYEKGINRIGAGRLFEVAGILGVPVSFFYEDADANGTASGFSEAGEPPPVMEFLASGEGLQLSLAFMRIKDVKVRRRILDLVRSLGNGNGLDDAED